MSAEMIELTRIEFARASMERGPLDTDAARLLYNYSLRGHPKTELPVSDSYWSTLFIKDTGEPTIVGVGYVDNEPVGALKCFADTCKDPFVPGRPDTANKKVLDILLLAVPTHCRGQGIGRQMMAGAGILAEQVNADLLVVPWPDWQTTYFANIGFENVPYAAFFGDMYHTMPVNFGVEVSQIVVSSLAPIAAE